MHFTKVTVRRDETAAMVIHVGAWEIPVLEAKHGEEKLEVGELKDFPNREWPTDPRSEMQRLNKLYGVTSAADGAPTFAEKAYGPGSAGIRALGAAMEAARKAATGKTGRGRPRKPASDLVGQQAG